MSTELRLLVLRVSDLERARRFYEALGLRFESERHGNGPAHFVAQLGSLVFELYPRQESRPTHGVRLGFRVVDLEQRLLAATRLGGRLIEGPAQCSEGARAVISDPDGHTIELQDGQPSGSGKGLPPIGSAGDSAMQTVFLVHHVHELGDGREDVKLIGVFSTEEKALAALERLKLQPGFRESVSGFHVDRRTVDQVDWTEGFVTIDPSIK